MRLEQAILDRLEKRNGQIAQLQSTVHALERAADSEREHARQQLAQQKNESHGLRQLVNEKMAINEQLAEQITTARLEREQMQHQIAELRTERDRILEVSKTLVPKSALKQAVQEAAELHAEVVKLRAEVPLESTREGLKNAVAKLQEVNAQLDSAKGEAEEWLKQCHAARRQRDEVKAEARKETQRLSDLCAELQVKYESLLAKTTDLGSYAMTIGRKEGEPLEMFMERQALRLAALESKARPSIDFQAMANNLVSEVAKLKVKLGAFEKMYEIIKALRHEQKIMAKYKQVYAAVDDVTEALSQLTA